MNREKIDEIRDRINIVDVISRYVNLKKTGKSYKGLCPFHEDSDPSLTVSPAKNLWYCFGCGSGGDIFKFMMEIENLTFPQAAQRLGREAGVDFQADSDQNDETQTLKRLLRRITKYYHKNLLRDGVGRKARSHLEKRGYGKNTIDQFEIGYALPGWQSLTNKFKRKYGVEALEKAGLVKRSDKGRVYDRFRDRIMIPIKSPDGSPIGFGGRRLSDSDDGPKYLNSPNTSLFQKGCTLFGLDLARDKFREEGYAILVEGYTDAIAPQSKGMENVVASLGTALTEKQVSILRRYVDKVIIAFDRDQAGEKATLKSLRLLRNKGLTVEVAQLPRGLDPADIVENEGINELREIIRQSIPFHKFYLDILEKNHDLSTVEGREKALQSSVDFLKHISSPPLRYELIGRLKDLLRIPEEELEKQISTSTTRPHSSRPKVNRTQENLTPGEWLIRLQLEGRLSLEEIRRTEIFSELDERYKTLATAIAKGKKNGRQLDEIGEELDEEMAEILTKIALQEIPIDDQTVEKASRDTVNTILKKIRNRKIQQLKHQLEIKQKKGAKKRELNEIQQQILELQREKITRR